MKNVIVIVGPTASGKTKMSIELAKLINGEIISADSMQIYKYLNIATAKPTKKEMDGIKHYLIDEILPNIKFSVAKYQELALKYIGKVINKGKIPIVVGGTGLYIDSLIYNINFSKTQTNWEYRNELNELANKYGNLYLYNKLKKIDIKAAEKIHENDTKRIIRALEVYEFTNKKISDIQKESKLIPPKYDYTVFGLSLDRTILYDRINLRVDNMLDQGLIAEAKTLLELGYDSETTAMKALGYKDIIKYLNNELTFEESINLIKRDSRRYAKRQMTWFNRLKEINWLEFGDDISEEKYRENLNIILKHLGFSCRIDVCKTS
ncbi:MAG: tRNA (adenosine(37)-N6)-dimethylallyltransferase MiaA [Clostridiales bacterium]